MSTFIWNGGVIVPNVPNDTLCISGQYISGSSSGVPGTLLAPEGVLHYVPIVPGRNITINQLAVNVEVAGSAGSVVRLGIYDNITATDLPDGIILDAGIVATDTPGLKTITIAKSLSGGDRYWLAAVQQGGATLAATYTSFTLATGTVPAVNPNASFNGLLQLGVNGALPISSPVTPIGSQIMIRVLARIA